MSLSSSPISTSAAVEDTADKVVCKLCRRQFAKYTCPTCNIPYCSLTCFRSDSHSQCSEPFYKKELETGISAEPSKTAKERGKMLQLLKRFEEESVEELDDDEEDSEMARRLASVDLDSVAPDALWEMLTPAEKNKFLKAMSDPSSELAQQLLSLDELQNQISEPWWTSLPVVPTNRFSTDKVTYPPSEMEIPASLLKPIPGRPLLAYNLAAIGMAYAYIVRHLGVSSLAAMSPEDPGFQEPYQLLARFVPFLLDRKSTLVFPNLDAVVTDLSSRFDSNVASSDLFTALLQDASKLTSPQDIVDFSPPTSSNPETTNLLSHPHQLPLLLLSDLRFYFSVAVEKQQAPPSLKHLAHKLVFYAAHVVTIPAPLLRGLAHELKREGDKTRGNIATRGGTAPVMIAGRPSQSMAGRIEELCDSVPGGCS